MTLIVTHTQGFLGCFTQAPDGSMMQRALIDIGQESLTPQALAKVGTELAHQYGWSLNGAVPVSGRKTKPALPVAKRTRRVSGDPIGDERKQLILNYVGEHPDSSIREIVQGCGLEPNHDRISRWHHTFSWLIKNGLLTADIRRGHGRVKHFRIRQEVASDGPLPEDDG